MKTPRFILIAVMAVAFAVTSFGSAHAVQVLNFDLPAATPTSGTAGNFGNFVGSTRTPTNPSGSITRYAFDPTASGRFTNTVWGTNNIPWFSGGAQAQANNPDPALPPAVMGFFFQGNVGSREVIAYARDNDAAPDYGFVLNNLLVWDKSQFINGGDASTVSFSSLSMNVKVFNTSVATDGLRFVVKNADQYYLSQSLFTVSSGTISVTGTQQWATFNPTATDFVMPNAGSLTFSTPSSSLTNVTQVGLASSTTRTAFSGGLTFDQFSFSGTLVPEPSTYAMLLGGGGIGAVALLRRRKKA
jgi:hypothetical protein